jgi:hypothetical protein
MSLNLQHLFLPFVVAMAAHAGFEQRPITGREVLAAEAHAR